MSKVLIKQVTIVDPNSEFNGNTKDVLIENGFVSEIGNTIVAEGATVVTEPGLCLSPGFFDMGTNGGEPGFEHQEDLNSVTSAALAGGFTSIALLPDNKPVTQTKAEIEYIKTKTKESGVNVYPVGALSIDLQGKDMSEMYDMQTNGAVAFYNGKHPINSSGFMMRSLLYAQQFDGLIMTYSDDKGLSQGGKVHEGVVSTKLGLKGRPAIAEELMVQRDLSILEYTGGKLHLNLLSTPDAVSMLKAAKAKGLNVTASVSSYHLALTDEEVTSFDSNFKTLPPLRPQSFVDALVQGLKENVIDVIVSDHTPFDIESKHKEFDLAEFGIINLQTSFAVANTATKGKLSTLELIQKMAVNPRKILGLEIPVVKVGQKAEFTLFNPEAKWTFTKEQNKSKSINSPFFNKELIGKVVGVINGGYSVFY